MTRALQGAFLKEAKVEVTEEGVNSWREISREWRVIIQPQLPLDLFEEPTTDILSTRVVL